MRHYEIVFMVHPDQSEQVPGMLDRYSNIVKQVPRLPLEMMTFAISLRTFPLMYIVTMAHIPKITILQAFQQRWQFNTTR